MEYVPPPPPAGGPPSGRRPPAYYPPGYRPGRRPPRPRPSPWLPALPLVLNRNRGYELYATLNGQGVPVDTAMAAWRLWRPLVQWHLLGGYQGDEGRGFGLSGPGGPVMLQGLASGVPPELYGTPAYIGGHAFDDLRGSRVELLSASWLTENLGPTWWALAGGT